MLVSHRHKFVFIKTGKTGGTSTEIYLEPYCVNNIRESHKTKCRVGNKGIVGSRLRKSELNSHMTAVDIRDTIGHEAFRSYTKIANVRNPFDLMVSHYHYQPTYFRHAGRRQMTFHQYVMNTVAVRSISRKTSNHLFIGNKFIVDEVIRQESLEQDLEALRVKLGLPAPKRELGHYKESKDRSGIHYSTFYKEDSRKVVQRHFRWYMDLFGYDFEEA